MKVTGMKKVLVLWGLYVMSFSINTQSFVTKKSKERIISALFMAGAYKKARYNSLNTPPDYLQNEPRFEGKEELLALFE